VTRENAPILPEGLVVFVKEECATCRLVAPLLPALGATVYTQDDPTFPAGTAAVHDEDLSFSWHHEIETVPTLILVRDGREVERTVGWSRDDWQRITGDAALGAELPPMRPGCGSMSVDPDLEDALAARFGASVLASRRIELATLDDEFEAIFERGCTDGLPVVPPTEKRVLRMLAGTTRDPKEGIGLCPPNLAELTVEKVAINAVMAGCKPEYLPVVLAAVEAALDPAFSWHGVLATTMFVGPVVVVNGPVRRQIGMNARGNALGQGNRANATIGRALQLVIRNVGGGRPQEVDRATLGNPGKYTYCFAEDEEGSCWEPLSADFGVARGVSAVTVFAGYGLQGVVDQKSRTPESLARSFAESLKVLHNVKLAPACDAMLVVSPEHERTFRAAGWSKARLLEELYRLCEVPIAELVRGAKGIDEGLPATAGGDSRNKLRKGGLLIVRAGGGAGMFSGIIGGWTSGGFAGSVPVNREVKS